MVASCPDNRERCHSTIESATNSTYRLNTEYVHPIVDDIAINDVVTNRNTKVCSIQDDLGPKSRQTSLLSFFTKGTFSKSRQNSKNKNDNSNIETKVQSLEKNKPFSISRRLSPKASSSSAYDTSAKRSLSPSPPCKSKKILQRRKPKSLTQVYIDCGQSKFGQILCNKCGMLYMPGILEDEIQHERQCQAYTLGIPCNRGNVKGGKQVDAWKNESRMNCVDEATIVLWRPCIKAHHSKKSREGQVMAKTDDIDSNTKDRPSQWPMLARMIAKDLGTDEETTLDHLTNVSVFLYISKNTVNTNMNKEITNLSKAAIRHRILGVATVQLLGDVHAYRMISLYERSRKPVREAKLGVGLLWTHPIARKRGIATKLVHAAREHAIFGMQIAREDVAFSNPTQAGYNFALRYTNNEVKSDSDARISNKSQYNAVYHNKLNHKYESINSKENQEEGRPLCSRNTGPLVYEMNL